MDQPKQSVPQAPERTDSPAIVALADHLKVTTEDIHAWLREENGVPMGVLLSWIGLWDRRRRPQS
ncbi:MAG TPA: hypothetical protein VGP97_10510 [Burkholderiales bacterium]|jgi:hypothetical protein|nr:hypothetical protein [Burkholderiales bacterium]